MEFTWFQRTVSSPEWWFTAVVVGVIVGVLSTYAKTALDALLARLGRRYGAWSASQRAERERLALRCVLDPDLHILEMLEHQRLRTQSFVDLLASCVMFGLGAGIPHPGWRAAVLTLSAAMMVLSINPFMRAVRGRAMVVKALVHRRKLADHQVAEVLAKRAAAGRVAAADSLELREEEL